MKKWYWIQLLFILISCFPKGGMVPKAHAAISSCYAIISPNTTPTNAQRTYTFTIENQDTSSAAPWVNIQLPTTDLTIVSGSATGWSAQVSDSQITFTGGSIPASQSKSFSVTINAKATETTFQLTVLIASDTAGTTTRLCDGTLGITVSSTAVAISSLSVSSVTDTSATITFSTNIAATSTLKYGTTSSYGTTKTITTATTSHSYSLTGLSKNTTYHYQVTATAGSASDTSTDQTFNTSVTATPAPTSTPVATPTPTPDTTPPVVFIESSPPSQVGKAPVIKGGATDNVSVEQIEYTVDDGKHWINVKTATGLTTASATFSFTPTASRDGKVTIKVRAKDPTGNIGMSRSISFTIDQTGPEIVLITSLDHPYPTTPKIEGRARDPSGVKMIEYSLKGKNWQPVDTISEEGQDRSFSFEAVKLDDGNYSVSLRATDVLGNVGPVLTKTLLIDRLPPRVGAVVVTIGPQIITPEQDTLTTIQNIPYAIKLSLVGGPTLADLILTSQDNTTSPVHVPLHPLENTTLWGAEFALPEKGTYQMSLHAQDGAGNTLDKNLFRVLAQEQGTVKGVQDELVLSTIRLFERDATNGSFVLWDGKSYGQYNPLRQTPNGENTFGFYVPAGNYYLEITPQDKGYKQAITTIITKEKSGVITPSIILEKAATFSFLGFHFTIPSFTSSVITLTNRESPTLPSSEDQFQSLIFPSMHLVTGNTIFNNSDIEEHTTLLVLMNSWHPFSGAVLEELGKFKKRYPQTPLFIILPQETPSQVLLYKLRGGYQFPMLADPDGDILTTLPYPAVPTYMIVGPKGIIEHVHVGVLSEPGMEEFLLNGNVTP